MNTVVIPAKAGIHKNVKSKILLCVYISEQENGTLYIGVTNNLIRRVYEHKNGLVKGFTNKYEVNRLVYYEAFNDIQEAIIREKQLKKWNRQRKIRLIKEMNPDWKDLAEDW